MQRYLSGDVIAGTLILIAGGTIAGYCYATYPVGTGRNVGPAVFPVLVGGFMALCGAVHLVVSLIRGGLMPEVELRPLLAVLASLVTFALLIEPAGIVPAVFCLTLVSGLARKGTHPGAICLLGAGLALAAAGLFGTVLGISAPILRWPF